jgi:hypothetical protein
MTVSGFAEDVRVRQEAVRLLERASAVSIAPTLPNLERTSTFRVYGSDSGVQEGTFTRVVIQGVGRREETVFGDYQVIDVFTEGHIATQRTREVAPPEIQDLMWLTPINLVYFDREDVIHAIVPRDVSGRAARCIEFDTIAGSKTQNNELCVDAANGSLLLEKLGDRLVENRAFFPFAGMLMPARISYSYRGTLKMEITQSITLLENGENVLAAPPSAQIRTFCKTFRRPFGVFMPQPKPGNGGGDAEVLLRGLIGVDGKIHEAVVQTSERPDLNAEALALIQQWTFTPGICDGRPNQYEASFVMHFQGR